MDFILLYRRIRDIFTNPASMWRSVRDESRAVSELRQSFLIPMAILLSVSGFIGTMINAYSGLSMLYPLIIALKYLLAFTITVEVTSRVVTEITLAFIPASDFSINYKLILYSFTPFMVTMMITRIFPSLVFLNLGGLYGTYIALKGVEILTETPQSLRVRYIAVITLTTIVFYFAVSFIVKIVLDGIYYAFT